MRAASQYLNSEIEKKFFEYLISIGFPQSSVIYEPIFQPIGEAKKYRPDFALVDPATKEPLAIIEIKGRNDPNALLRALKQLNTYLAALNDQTIRGYVVTPVESGDEFNFYTLGVDGGPKQTPSTAFLKLESLLAEKIAKKKALLSAEKNATTNQFIAACLCSSAFAITVAIADFIFSRYGIVLLKTERLALVGVAITLVIAPYVHKIKAFGIELENSTTSQSPK